MSIEESIINDKSKVKVTTFGNRKSCFSCGSHSNIIVHVLVGANVYHEYYFCFKCFRSFKEDRRNIPVFGWRYLSTM